MAKKYHVTLTPEERGALGAMVATGKAAARKLAHARVLLKADEAEGGPRWPDAEIADALDAGAATVARVRQRFVEEGLELAISPYRATTRRAYKTKLDGAQEAHLIAIACSAPPDGRARWTLSLLAGRMVELRHVDSVSRETVRRTPKKTSCARS